MAETLYKISIVDEEQEAKDDEERLPSVLYQTSLGELTYILKNNYYAQLPNIHYRSMQDATGEVMATKNTLWIHEKT